MKLHGAIDGTRSCRRAWMRARSPPSRDGILCNVALPVRPSSDQAKNGTEMKSMKSVVRLSVVAIAIVAIAFFPPVALAACPPWIVYSHTYFDGCGTKT